MKRTRFCYWPHCPEKVQPSILCCREHWYKLPKELRDRIWAAYRPGQESDGLLSREYVIALQDVRKFAAAADGREIKHDPIEQQGRMF